MAPLPPLCSGPGDRPEHNVMVETWMTGNVTKVLQFAMPHSVSGKGKFVHDFANSAGRESKTYQASLGLSAIAELLRLIRGK